jgi:hypothetical protein
MAACFRAEAAQRSQLVALEGMRAGGAVLDPTHVEHRAIEINLVPSEIAQLGCSEPLTEGHQDRGRVSMPVPAFLCSFDHGIDLGRRKVFATANLGIRTPSWRNSSIYFGWHCRTEF